MDLNRLKEMLIEAALAGDAEWLAHEDECHQGDESWMDCTYTGPGITSAFITANEPETIYATPEAIVALVTEWLDQDV